MRIGRCPPQGPSWPRAVVVTRVLQLAWRNRPHESRKDDIGTLESIRQSLQKTHTRLVRSFIFQHSSTPAILISRLNYSIIMLNASASESSLILESSPRAAPESARAGFRHRARHHRIGGTANNGIHQARR
jgi:hypothetical protein